MSNGKDNSVLLGTPYQCNCISGKDCPCGNESLWKDCNLEMATPAGFLWKINPDTKECILVREGSNNGNINIDLTNKQNWAICADIKAPSIEGYTYRLNPLTQGCELVANKPNLPVTTGGGSQTGTGGATDTGGGAGGDLFANLQNYKPLLILAAVVGGLYLFSKD